MHYAHIFRRLSIPFLLLSILFNINPKFNEVRASSNTIPANDKDIDLYRNMGITYICSASAKGNESDFEQSLVVAANLFSTVIQQKHGGFIKEGKNKKQQIDPKLLQGNIAFQLVGGALNVCPNSVPKEIENEFRNQYKKIQESDKK